MAESVHRYPPRLCAIAMIAMARRVRHMRKMTDVDADLLDGQYDVFDEVMQENGRSTDRNRIVAAP